jgi:histidine triad (HIT) family protein
VAEDCLFCKIASKRIPADVIFEDDKVVAFKDIEPQAPVHILVIPKVHIPTINGLSDASLAGHLVLTATSLASQLGISESGYRLVMNCNEDSGQTVFHIHLHILGGHQLTSMV